MLQRKLVTGKCLQFVMLMRKYRIANFDASLMGYIEAKDMDEICSIFSKLAIDNKYVVLNKACRVLTHQFPHPRHSCAIDTRLARKT